MANDLKRLRVHVQLDEAIWALLHKYHLVVRERARANDWPLPELSKLVGAIVVDFFLAHREEILEEVYDAESAVLVRKLSGRLEPSELAQVGFGYAAVPRRPKPPGRAKPERAKPPRFRRFGRAGD